MFDRVIEGLTTDQKRELAAHGVDKSTLSRWRKGDRLPTQVQATWLASIANVDRHELNDEIALLRASTPEERSALQRAMGKLRRGVAASFALAVVVAAALAGTPSTSQARSSQGSDAEARQCISRSRRMWSFA